MSDPHHQQDASGSDLRRRRDELAEQVAELHWNLGGLAYEMAIRDHFRLDVLVRRAGMLQERDAELAEIERLLRMQESSVAGSCASCGAVRSRGAVFCWQCGAQVMEQSAPADGNGARARVQPEWAGAVASSPVESSQLESPREKSSQDGKPAAPGAEGGSIGRPVQTSA
jgi:uncharacterized Zn finger protein (UPF0148 family)